MKIKLYLLALLIFFGIDALWLGLIAPGFYRSQIGHLMAETPNLYAAGIFYLLFVGVLVYFVIEPALRIGNTRDVWVRGALFGLVTYATYDMTNLATLRDWPVLVTVVDLAWGTILTAGTAAASVWAGRKIL
ncbi:MAG TPA: DUF2177 family protein [Anaerolineales bacterium]|nr:DUF2177 family protein [Anaerolineales bacterium]